MRTHIVTHDTPHGLTTLSKPVLRGTGEHVARLIRCFENMFDCRQGLPRAWTQHPATTAENARLEALQRNGTVGDDETKWAPADRAFSDDYWSRDRANYRVLMIGIEGGPECEEKLCDVLRESVQDLLPDEANWRDGKIRLNPVLYWRLAHKIEFKVDEPHDERFNYHPEKAKHMAPQMTPRRASIYTRIATPDLDLSRCGWHTPEGGLTRMLTP